MADEADEVGRDAHGEVGSLAEEALKFAGAFTQWATQHGADVGRQAHGLGEHVRETWHEIDEHLATGAAECAVCPLCRTVKAVREVSPEVREHLGAAAGSLVQAAAGLLSAWSAIKPDAPTHRSRDECAGSSSGATDTASRVQGIPLDEELDPDE